MKSEIKTLTAEQEIASFSYDNNHTYRFDRSSLMRYWAPKTGTDLSAGFEKFRKWDDPIAGLKLDSLLQTLQYTEVDITHRIPADFVMWRGMATKLMMISYEPDSQLSLNMVCIQGTIYIQEDPNARIRDREQEKSRPWHGPHSSDKMTYWGYKFETVSTLPVESRPDRNWVDNRNNITVDNHAQFASIVQYRLGNHRLVLGGEVDCIDPAPPLPGDSPKPSRLPEYVELKTTAYPRGDGRAFRRKIFNSWAQSFLLGVPNVIFGYRDQNGILLEVERFRTDQLLRKMSRDGSGVQAGNRAIHLLVDILNCKYFFHPLSFFFLSYFNALLVVKRWVVDDGTVWVLENVPSVGIELRRIQGARPENIITPTYITHIAQMNSKETPEIRQRNHEIAQREMEIFRLSHERMQKQILAERMGRSQGRSEYDHDQPAGGEPGVDSWRPPRGSENHPDRSFNSGRPSQNPTDRTWADAPSQAGSGYHSQSRGNHSNSAYEAETRQDQDRYYRPPARHSPEPGKKGGFSLVGTYAPGGTKFGPGDGNTHSGGSRGGGDSRDRYR